MTFTRALTRQLCRMLAGVLLFAQFAVAGYACPGLSGMRAMASGVMAEGAEMAEAKSTAMSPGCDQIDPGAANLCAEHCRYGHQSADTAPASLPIAPVPALLYLLPLEPVSLPGHARARPAPDPVLAVPPPPHAILHCVYRI
ncbi:MAG TPA: hypothetical protein VJO99_15610 [Burkholderiaceae bacterium]|nr:hypothetical protein [Burkholderiaceae bacterium]